MPKRGMLPTARDASGRNNAMAMDLGILETLGLLLICGYVGGRLANRLKFPRVTGYIVAGILLSPSVSGILPEQLVNEQLFIINEIALAVIAFSVGGSLELSKLKRLGKSALVINATEGLGAFFLTFLLVATLSPSILHGETSFGSFVDVYLPLALIVAAVSAATAPAAVLAIVHEYKAQGPLTTTLLSVVALDDGLAIILYAFASSIVRSVNGAGDIPVHWTAIEPLVIIGGSLLLGSVLGWLLTILVPRVRKKESLLVVILGVTFFCSGLALHLNFSPLLACMILGLVVINTGKQRERALRALESLEEPIFALFFTLAGAHFNLMAFKAAGALAFVIAGSRFGGKLFGTRLGARMSHAPAVVRTYLGYALLPTAGVALGLAFMAQPLMRPELFAIMVNAVLGAVIISEIIAPPFVKYALVAAGEGSRDSL